MKKTLIFAGLLAIGFASAQEGKVGINTETPQATLEVQPNAANLRGTSNEGIIAPKLSKERIAAIATPIEGTLVYATDTTYTGTNAKVTKIDAKGYYFYNGTEWVKAAATGSAISDNLYTADGVLAGDRKVTMGDKILRFEGNDGAKYLEVKNASWFPLVVNSTNAQGGGIAVHPNNTENRIEFSANEKGDMRFYQHGNGDVMFVQKSTNRVGIGTPTPMAKLDVNGGDIVARGSGDVQTYIGGDGVGNDVELGSIKTGVTDVTLYNRADSRAMNLVSGAVDARGAIKSTTLSGDGDKIVMANNDGTLTKGVSVSSFATSNLYTADGTTNGDRTVSTANGFLTIKGNVWNPLVVNSEIVPSDPANNARGGIAVHPNDIEKRVEFATTIDGDSRIWLDGDKLFIKRATGNVGIGTNEPTVKLDVNGNARIQSLAGTGDRVVLADATGVLKTGTLPATSISGSGNLTGTGITVGNGAGSTLKNVTLAIADNAITSTKIQDGQVSTADLANGAVTSAKLDAMGATNGQVLKWNGTAWAPSPGMIISDSSLDGHLLTYSNNFNTEWLLPNGVMKIDRAGTVEYYGEAIILFAYDGVTNVPLHKALPYNDEDNLRNVHSAVSELRRVGSRLRLDEMLTGYGGTNPYPVHEYYKFEVPFRDIHYKQPFGTGEVVNTRTYKNYYIATLVGWSAPPRTVICEINTYWAMRIK